MTALQAAALLMGETWAGATGSSAAGGIRRPLQWGFEKYVSFASRMQLKTGRFIFWLASTSDPPVWPDKGPQRAPGQADLDPDGVRARPPAVVHAGQAGLGDAPRRSRPGLASRGWLAGAPRCPPRLAGAHHTCKITKCEGVAFFKFPYLCLSSLIVF